MFALFAVFALFTVFNVLIYILIIVTLLCFFLFDENTIKINLDDLFSLIIHDLRIYVLKTTMPAEYYSYLFVFCGLKDRLIAYLQDLNI